MTAAPLCAPRPVVCQPGEELASGKTGDGLADHLVRIRCAPRNLRQRRGDERALVQDAGQPQQRAGDGLFPRRNVWVVPEKLLGLRKQLVGSLEHLALPSSPAVIVTRQGVSENPYNASGPAADDGRARKWTTPALRRERRSDADITSTHRQDAEGTPVTPRKSLAALRAEIARLEKENAGLLERARRAELYGSAYARTIAARAAMDAGHLDPAELGLPCAAAGPGDTLEVPRPAGLPAGHPESLATELNPADEDELAELCTALWPNDEYLGITPDGPGAS